ncbi:Myosin-5 [Raphanus sativus]|nr:Myosin-5 [Raphanus sativus]
MYKLSCTPLVDTYGVHFQVYIPVYASVYTPVYASVYTPVYASVYTSVYPRMYASVCIHCSLVLRRECCLFSNGEYVKTGLAELDKWCHDATEKLAGSAWDELKHITQAVGFLVIQEKPKKSLHKIKHMCLVV